MKPTRSHRDILLTQAGTASRRQQQRAATAQQADPDMHRYAEDLTTLTQLARSTDAETAIAPATLQQLTRRAARPQRATAHWQPALAYATAALVLLISGWWTLHQMAPPAGTPYAEAPAEEQVAASKIEAAYANHWNELQTTLTEVETALLGLTAVTADDTELNQWATELLAREEQG